MRRDLASRRGGASYMRLLRAERAMLARRLREGYGDAYSRSSLGGASRLSRGLEASAAAYSDFAVDDFADLPIEDGLFDGGALDRYGGSSGYGSYY